MTVDEIVEEHIYSVIEDCGGNLTKAAKILGFTYGGLYQKLRYMEKQKARKKAKVT